jgi:hypothetical protein
MPIIKVEIVLRSNDVLKMDIARQLAPTPSLRS